MQLASAAYFWAKYASTPDICLDELLALSYLFDSSLVDEMYADSCV